MKIIILLLLLVSFETNASEDFSIEERFTKPVKIPASITSHLNKEISEDMAFCEDLKPEDMLEAQIVSLNKSSKAYLVKPATMCLCGVYYCPMWMFQIKGKKTSLIWSAPATGVMAILNTKANGYPQIKDYGGAASHGYKSIWTWSGKKYKETYRQNYSTDGFKGCFDVETFRLKGEKLVRVSNECLEDLPER